MVLLQQGDYVSILIKSISIALLETFRFSVLVKNKSRETFRLSYLTRNKSRTDLDKERKSKCFATFVFDKERKSERFSTFVRYQKCFLHFGSRLERCSTCVPAFVPGKRIVRNSFSFQSRLSFQVPEFNLNKS